MTWLQALRLRVWTFLQTILAFFRGTSRDEPREPSASSWGKRFKTAASAILSLGSAIGSRFKRAFSEITGALSSNYVAGFVVVLAILAAAAGYITATNSLRPELYAAHAALADAGDRNAELEQRLAVLASEKARLSNDVAALKAQLAEAPTDPVTQTKVVYRKSGSAAPVCSANCLFGWRF